MNKHPHVGNTRPEGQVARGLALRPAAQLPWPAVSRLREAAGTPDSTRRHMAVDAAITWVRKTYPKYFKPL